MFQGGFFFGKKLEFRRALAQRDFFLCVRINKACLSL